MPASARSSLRRNFSEPLSQRSLASSVVGVVGVGVDRPSGRSGILCGCWRWSSWYDVMVGDEDERLIYMGM
jgi:hypothetical protein